MFLSVPLTMVIKIILEHHANTHLIAVMLSPKEDVFKAVHAYSREKVIEDNSGKS